MKNKFQYCKKCVLPETHESIKFDEEGVCSVCRQSQIKHNEVNWDERYNILVNIVNKYRGKGDYDCIIPFSGGKDSTFQLWYVVKKLNLKPLVVRFNHWGFRPLVDKNNDTTFKSLGVDVVQFTPNFKIVKLLMLESLKLTGDFCWHCHCGVFANTMHTAIKYNVPLVIWGEASSEYRSYHTATELETLDKKQFDTTVNLGIDSNKMLKNLKGSYDIGQRDLWYYEFPSKEELDKLDVCPIYLGNYIKWNTKANVDIIKKELGWQGQDVEGIPPQYDYEKIECKWQGVRDYCKYIKRGCGRTNHLACIDIRNGVMDRDTALKLCEQYDGKRPASLDLFLEMLGITEDEFINTVSQHKIGNWVFDKNKVEKGKSLKDMKDW